MRSFRHYVVALTSRLVEGWGQGGFGQQMYAVKQWLRGPGGWCSGAAGAATCWVCGILPINREQECRVWI